MTDHTSAKHPNKKRLYVALTLLIGLMLGLILSEIGLRIYISRASEKTENSYVRFEKQRSGYKDVYFRVPTYRKVNDSAVGWEPIPNTKFGHTRINSGGFRGREYSQTPAPGTVRIVFLGDSEAYGERLREQDIVAGSLENQLNHMDTKHKYEVLNFGVLGYNTAQEYERLKRRAMPYQPRIVVLLYSLNDAEIAAPLDFTVFPLLAQSYLFRFASFYYHSAVSFSEIEKRSTNISDYYNRLHSSEYFDATKDS